ncbi:DNA-binding protein K10 [Anopheles nili]|uniref:DNA-binding protein K10 n=1 Tax=Anopheles nili TaxID=185578 RepID=UPI00237A323D|nr:DNA-binding protein K10 [Anopheles nili]
MVSNKAPNNDGNKRGGNQMPNRQRFKQGFGKQYNQMNNMRNMSAMFNANQLGDDPGFVDFNDDSITSANETGVANTNAANGSDSGSKNYSSGNRRMNQPMKRPMKNGGPGMRHRMNGGTNGMPNWGHPMAPPNMFPGSSSGNRRGPMNPPPIPPPVPPAHFRNGPGMRMRGPPNGRFGAGPPGPMSLLSMHRSLPPPIPPMTGRPMGPPLGMGRMMPPPLRHGPDGQMRRNVNGNLHGRGMIPKMNSFPRNGMTPNGGTIGPNGKRARTKPVQQREEYPLEKPWVTEEIKSEHDKKAELANRLKGHRDDALYAQFKEQRDKFVKMYEAARLEFIGKHPEQDVDKILTEPACKKARIDIVEKQNEVAAASDKLTKSEETTSSSAQITVSTVTSTDTTKAHINGSSNGPNVVTSTSTSNPNNVSPATNDTNDTIEIISTPANTESVPVQSGTVPVAASTENTAAV